MSSKEIKLADLLSELSDIQVVGSTEEKVFMMTQDSRAIKKGGLFFAVSGISLDGHLYIEDAVKNGASVIVCEKLPTQSFGGVTFVIVINTRKMIGPMAQRFYGNPAKKLELIGVTGTNGKTTTVSILGQSLESLGKKVGVIGTLGDFVNGKPAKTIRDGGTTPDPIYLAKVMAEMVEARCRYCCMEVTSHAVDQDRILGLCFSVGVFTNLTQDHLDYHENMQNYLSAKKKFLDSVSEDGFLIANMDDEYSAEITNDVSAELIGYSFQDRGDFLSATLVDTSIKGSLLLIDGQQIKTNLAGLYNAYNVVSAYLVLKALGVTGSEAVKLFTEISVPGRMQRIQSEEVTVFVDYAHTPDALENLLETVSEIKRDDQKITLIFGCGGDRDKTKRPLMGSIAARFADNIVLTNDNSRSEDPASIISDIAKGIPRDVKVKILIDRKEAIEYGIRQSLSGGIVLIVGKGHEETQEVQGKKYIFSDVQVIQDFLHTTQESD